MTARPRRSAAMVALVALAWLQQACGDRSDAPPSYAFAERRYAVSGTLEPSASSDGARRLTLSVTPREPWKLTTRFPIRMRLGTDDTSVVFDGHVEGERLRFECPVNSAAGTRTGVLSFAVCHGEICERVDHAISIAGDGGVSSP